jgi:hypothetical protein
MRMKAPRLILASCAVAAGVVFTFVLIAMSQGQAARSVPGARPAQSWPARAGTASAGFGWLRPQAAPAGWRSARLPGHPAVLSYPRWLSRSFEGPGTVTEQLPSGTGLVLVYLNVTPRQGSENLATWAGFRLAHLRDDSASAVGLDATSAVVPFRGGRGRCVMDDYTTKVGRHHYREFACYVQAATADGSVLVAASPAADWPKYVTVLEQVVSAYRAA